MIINDMYSSWHQIKVKMFMLFLKKKTFNQFPCSCIWLCLRICGGLWFKKIFEFFHLYFKYMMKKMGETAASPLANTKNFLHKFHICSWVSLCVCICVCIFCFTSVVNELTTLTNFFFWRTVMVSALAEVAIACRNA